VLKFKRKFRRLKVKVISSPNAQIRSGANPVSGLIGTGDIATGAWGWLHTCIQRRGEEWVDCTSTPPICLHGLCMDSFPRHLFVSIVVIVIIPSAVRNWQWFSRLRSYLAVCNQTSISEFRRTRRSSRATVFLHIVFFPLWSSEPSAPDSHSSNMRVFFISFVLHARPTLPCSM